MKDNPAANVQFCDEYEELFHKCLDALTHWNQLRGFNEQAAPARTRASREMRQAQQTYSATFLELRAHARRCVVCEEMLQANVNGSDSNAAYRVF